MSRFASTRSLHCARPATGCEAHWSDRVLANRLIYHFRDPHRKEIIVFKTPPAAKLRCGAGGVFVKRLIGLGGEHVSERNGYVYIDGKRLDEPYLKPDRRDHDAARSWAVPHGADFFLAGNRRE